MSLSQTVKPLATASPYTSFTSTVSTVAYLNSCYSDEILFTAIFNRLKSDYFREAVLSAALTKTTAIYSIGNCLTSKKV